jgi:hypothetical protein
MADEIYDFYDDIPKGLFVRTQKGFGDYEYLPYEKVIDVKGNSKGKLINRDAIGSVLLFDKDKRMVGRFRPLSGE